MASEDDNYGSLSVKGTPVADLKVNDIKKELDKRGLSKAGSKTQMLERLKAQLLLEKLQQDAAQSSGDELEGKVPNMALQQESAGQSEFVRQYLEQQQRNLERQMEVKKQVEEERKRKSADESSADETATHKEPKVDPEVTSPKKFKDDNSNAPATDESKMPRPARKSSRNASKGENGQDSGVVKEKSRSPSPEKESLRERTRSGSSSSSRSATPEASSRRGRSTRGSRGGRRGGRRGRGRAQVSRKESRSSSHSSSEEEVMPKKRSCRSTNSRSSRSRSRSPSLKTSPDLTPATRRSSRRISAAKTPPDHDLSTTDSEVVQKSKESAVATKGVDASCNEKGKDADPEVEEAIEDAKDVDVKEVRQSVEVLEPAESTIKTIEVAKIKNVEEEKDSATKLRGNEILSETSAETRDKHNSEIEETKPEHQSQLKEKLDKEQSKLNVESDGVQNFTISTDQSIKIDSDKEKQNIPEQTEDGIKSTNKRGRQRKGSSSSSSSSSPPRKRDANRSRSVSSGSSTDVSPNVNENLLKKVSPMSTATPEESTPCGNPDEKGQEALDQDQQEKSKPELQATTCSSHPEHGKAKMDDGSELQKSSYDKSEFQHKTSSEGKELSGAKKGEDAGSKELQEKAADMEGQEWKNEDEAVGKKDKTAKKRKWGSKTSKTTPAATKKPTSMEISSDSLKNLIGEVKLSETVFDMETEVVNTLDYDEQEEDRRDVLKVKRTVVKNSPSGPDEVEMDEEDARKVEASGDAPEESGKEQEPVKLAEGDHTGDDADAQEAEPKKKVAKSIPSDESLPKEGTKKKITKELKKVKKKKVAAMETTEGKENKALSNDKVESKETAKIIATTRPSKPILPIVDEPEKVAGRGDMSPARHPPDRVLRIAGLVRPFTVGQLKELLRRTGELDEEHFWINDIKSHCLAAFKTEEDAVKTRAALHGTRWPQSNPKILHVDFSTVEDVVHRKSGGEGPPPALLRKNQEQRNQRESKPESKKDPIPKDREDKERATRQRPSTSEQGEKRKEGDKHVRERPPPQIREWDKDKMKQFSRSRSKSKERERLSRRSRSRERDQRKRRDGSRERREDEKKKEKRQKEPKAEEEPPAKLLDDLFRKTKATPCIYWLPLTEEQAKQKAIEREEREKEKQKRRAAAEEKEKEELKKREAARLERQKQREKERERSRERDRSGGRDRSRDRKSRERGRVGRAERSRVSRSRSGSANRSRRRR